LVDNRGNDYRNHLKCITEDQKYGGKGFEAKSNKGEVKQQQWIQVNDNADGCLNDTQILYLSYIKKMYGMLLDNNH
jgi:hypothetical protein